MKPKKLNPRQNIALFAITAVLISPFARAAEPATPDKKEVDKSADVATGASRDKSDDPSNPEKEVTIELSPFEVTVDNNGYYAANTMSGTRLNGKIEDLGSAISIVTKQQMSDFGMLNINDVFSYEVSTEGTGNYSAFSAIRGSGVSEDIAKDPVNANRIRGLTSANNLIGNFATLGRAPIDPINLDAVEISRGPNSSIFGIGNPGGSVNSVPSSANLSANKTQVTARGDDRGGYRSTLDVGRVLVPGVLAVRGSVVFQHDAYTLKPSGTNTARVNGMLKYHPFKGTTFKISYSRYQMNGNRPNTFTPVDGVSDWKALGSPTWDPVTQTVHINGQAVGTYTNATSGIPAFDLNSIATTSASPSTNGSEIYVDRTGIAYWSSSRGTSGASPIIGNQSAVLMESAPYNWINNQPLFGYNATVSDRSIYDWKNINILAPNRTWDTDGTTIATLEQVLFNTERQHLTAELGWYHESSKRMQYFGSNQQSVYGTIGYGGIMIDVNERLLDGRPNPYFLRPYVQSVDPYTISSPADKDTYRAQLAYELDLTKARGWTRWLGKHQLAGYYEYNHAATRNIRWRDVIVSNNSWIPSGIARASTGAFGGLAAGNYTVAPVIRYYVGDNVGQNFDYAPGSYVRGNYNLEWGNAVSGVFQNEPVTLGSAVQGVLTGGSQNSEQILKTGGSILQSHFLDDRIITTVGARYDKRYTRNGGTPQYQPDGINIDESTYNSWLPGWPSVGKGRTTTEGIVVRPLSWLSVFGNRSNSFQPTSPATSVLPWDILPDPTGKGEDYGVTLTLWHGKLVFKANQYTTTQFNARDSIAASRLALVDRFPVPGQAGSQSWTLQGLATQWATAAAAANGQTLTGAALTTAVAGIMKVPERFLGDYPYAAISSTRDQIAKGYEFELNYNPSSYWTMKVNIAQQKSYYDNTSKTMSDWLAQRLAAWQTIIDPTTNQPWYTSSYNGSTPKSYVDSQIIAPLQLDQALEGKNNAQIRKYRVNLSTNLRLSGITGNPILKNFNIGGAVRWEDRGGIGYYGVQQYPAQITAYDINRPIYDKAHTYIDLLAGYRTRIEGIPTSFQFNIRNLNENGRLQPVQAYPNGIYSVYRIIEPRQFILTATFDL